ncbi:tyrosine-type recombinase/integrase [Verrucomicrobia bacterium]|nr:tyrosine-type recombinase/integrase [Verrucomicrobiota bacterium]
MKRKANRTRFTVSPFTNPSGETAYRVSGYKLGGERIRENYQTIEQALARQQELEIGGENDKANFKPKITTLSDPQLREAEMAVVELDGSGSILQAARFFKKKYRPSKIEIAVEDAFKEFIKAQERNNLRPETLRDNRRRGGLVAKAYGGRNVSDVSTEDLELLIHRLRPVNHRNCRKVFSTFFSWCVRRKYCDENPAKEMSRPIIDKGVPVIMTLQEVKEILWASLTMHDSELVPYTSLYLFGGLRPGEIERLKWSSIDLETGLITVDDEVSKLRDRRNIEIPKIKGIPMLRAWLGPYAKQAARIVGQGWKWKFDAIKEEVGWNTEGRPFVPDLIRHTSISYHLEWCKNEGETALWAGNSPNIIHKHYKGLVKPKDGEKFWALTPAKIKKEMTK